MKKNKKNKICKSIFMIFFISFLVIYLSELTGYYEYQNYKKTELTKEQIEKFENDVASGKEIDIDEYLIKETSSYNNNLTKLTSNISTSISSIIKKGVESTFEFISNLING